MAEVYPIGLRVFLAEFTCAKRRGNMNLPHNKRMHTDLTSHYAACEAADAGRYATLIQSEAPTP